MLKNKGFTLIELMVVMAIIAVLATLIIGGISVARKTSRATKRTANAKTLETALENFYTRNKKYPTKCATGCDIYTTKVTANPGGLQPVLVPNYLSNNIEGLDDYVRYKSDSSGSKYTLSVCSEEMLAENFNQDLMVSGTVDVIGAEGPCVGGTVIFSTAR